MKNYIIPFCVFCVLIYHSCASTQNKELLKTDVNPKQYKTAELSMEQSMMIPDDAKKTKSGFAYASLKKGSGIKPKSTDAVNVRLCVHNLEGNVIDEGTGTLAISHSTPFFEEILPLIEIGETIRIWGESQARIWDIEILSIDENYAAPQDVASPPAEANLLDGYDDIYWRVIEDGQGDFPKDGQALRIHVSRWNSDGAILESTRAGRGMLLFLNEEQKKLDDIHHRIVKHIKPGGHVRMWIPASHLSTPDNIVEDIWLAEYLTMLETPKELAAPANDKNLIQLPQNTVMRFESRRDNPIPLKTNQAVEVDMTCWNPDSGQLIDASYLRDQHDIMEITPNLGIWQQIMEQAAPGDRFITWIPKQALPENVNMSLTCKVQVFDIVI